MKQLFSQFSLVVAMMFFFGCAASHTAARSEKTSFAQGISGLVQIDSSRYLAVHDALSFEDGPRVSLLTVSSSAVPIIVPVTIDDWMDRDGRSSDLESLCAIPSRPNEFLMAESGRWEGRFGRLFHIRFDPATHRAVVLGVARLPNLCDNNPEQVGDQYEGMACLDDGSGSVVLILGERGGSARYPSGVLRWVTFDLRTHTLLSTQDGLHGIRVDAPGGWPDHRKNRDISDLFVASDGSLWASAAWDSGDAGPFSSLVYRIGYLRQNSHVPVVVNRRLHVWRTCDGIKVEGVAAPPSALHRAVISVGSDDENYGGVWRPLR